MKKDLSGTRTLFECNQFRTTTSMDDEIAESVTRKRSIQSEELTSDTVAKKYWEIFFLSRFS